MLLVPTLMVSLPYNLRLSGYRATYRKYICKPMHSATRGRVCPYNLPLSGYRATYRKYIYIPMHTVVLMGLSISRSLNDLTFQPTEKTGVWLKQAILILRPSIISTPLHNFVSLTFYSLFTLLQLNIDIILD